MKDRQYVESNLLEQFPHPKVGKRVITTFRDYRIVGLLDIVNPQLYKTSGWHSEAVGNLAIRRQSQ